MKKIIILSFVILFFTGCNSAFSGFVRGLSNYSTPNVYQNASSRYGQIFKNSASQTNKGTSLNPFVVKVVK